MLRVYKKMAGVPGFEPGNAGIKTLCLTTWRHPNYILIVPYDRMLLRLFYAAVVVDFVAVSTSRIARIVLVMFVAVNVQA